MRKYRDPQNRHGRPGSNCRHCGDAPKKGKRRKTWYSKKKIDVSKLIDKIKAYLYERFKDKDTLLFFRKEEIAVYFKTYEHLVAQALHQLNLQGLVSQPSHTIPHDCNRDPHGWGGDSSWQGDLYWYLKP